MVSIDSSLPGVRGGVAKDRAARVREMYDGEVAALQFLELASPRLAPGESFRRGGGNGRCCPKSTTGVARCVQRVGFTL